MNFNLKILVTAFFILLTSNNLFGAENQANNIMILFSCNVYGETDPCGWQSNQLGGLSGKAFRIEKAIKKASLPHIIVDSGNLLFKIQNTQSRTTAEILTAETIMQTYSIMGYDAIAVSSSDLTAGQVFLKKTNVPWVSSNILDDSGKLLFDPFIIKKVGDLKVGVIGLTGPGNYKNDKIIISDWRESFPRQVADLKSRTDMVVLLSNFPSSENEEIARKYPEVNVILTADNRQGNRPPHLAGSALITQTQSRGKYLGKLLIQFSPERKWSDDTRRTTPVTNFYKADFIPIRPSAPQSQEVNLMVKELKQKKRQLKKR